MIKEFDNEYWKRMSFKGNKVWVETDGSGQFIVKNNLVRIKYNLKQNYEYKVHPGTLNPEEQAVPSTKKKDKGITPKDTGSKNKTTAPENETAQGKIPENCIKIFTDGASSGNPGPAGIGALLIYGENRKEISKFIGTATNNVAELTAIKAALVQLKRKDLPVRIFSDSSYAIGLLTKGWKPQTNQKLVAELRELLASFDNIEFIKVKGHAGIKENEVADYLATSAIKKGSK